MYSRSDPKRFEDNTGGMPSSIHIKNLPVNVKLSELYTFFKDFGCIGQNAIHIFPEINVSEKMNAIIHFNSPTVVKEILYRNELNEIPFRGTIKLDINVKEPNNAFPTAKRPHNASSQSGNIYKNESQMQMQQKHLSETEQNITDDDTCVIIVQNIKSDYEDNLYALFKNYGNLAPKPNGVQIVQDEIGYHFARVKFLSRNSVHRVFVDLTKLKRNHPEWMIRPAQANVDLSLSKNNLEINDLESVTSECTQIDQMDTTRSNNVARRSFQLLYVTNLPRDIESIELFKIFGTHGTIAEPPGIIFDKATCKATIPYEQKRCVEKLMTTSNGMLPIRHHRHFVNIMYTPTSESSSGVDAFHIDQTSSPKCSANHISVEVIPEFKTDDCFDKQNDIPRDETLKLQNVVDQMEKSQTEEKLVESIIIQVRNVEKLSSKELLQQYFSNERHSKGGRLTEIKFSELSDLVFLKFEDHQVARRVLAEKHHKLEDCRLFVSKLPPIADKVVYLDNIPDWVSITRLEEYLGYRFLCEVSKFTFRQDNAGAMVEIATEKDFNELQTVLRNKPLRDRKDDEKEIVLEIHKIYQTDAVFVIGQIPSEDALILSLENYLENMNKSINAEIRYCVPNFHNQESITLVIFEDYTVVALLGDHVMINSVKFPIFPFYDIIGCSKPRDDVNFRRKYVDAKFLQPLTDLEHKYLQRGGNMDRLRTVLKTDCNWVFQVGVEEKFLVVNATNRNLSEKIADGAKMKLTTVTLGLDESRAKLLQSKTAIMQEELKKLPDEVIYEWKNDSLSLVTLYPDELKKVLEGYFGAHTTYSEIVTKNVLEYKFLKQFHERDLERMTKDHPAKIDFDNQLQHVKIEGVTTSLQFIRDHVTALLLLNDTSEYVLHRPGMSDFFRNAGQQNLPHFQNVTKTIIMDDKLMGGNYVADQSIKGCHLEGTLNNVRILVIHGDMTEQDVDCIVNAANCDLDHTGGLAGAIRLRAGMSVQEECWAHTKDQGKTLPGHNFVSKPGALKCKHIIHAVGPMWRGGNQNEKSVLNDTVANVIKTADKLGAKNVAIPAISTNIFGYPVDRAIPVIVNAALFTNSSNVTEIRFVDLNKYAIDLIIAHLKQLKGFTVNTAPVNRKKWQESDENKDSSRYPDILVFEKQSVVEQSSQSPTPNEKSLVINGCGIEVVRSSIISIASRYDAIVNSTGSAIAGGGHSSQAILNTAGQALMDDVAVNYPNGMNGQAVAVTVAGNLGCKSVFHIALPAYSAGTCSNEFKVRIDACLDEADASAFSSIAFTAMGTGGLKYPPDVAAGLMFESVSKWLQSTRNSSLKRVSFVLLPSDLETCKTFDAELQARGGSLAVNAPQTHSVRKDSTENAVQIGHLKVEVVEGDITKEKSDAVVCPSNSDFDLGGQVARALVQASRSGFSKVVADLQKKYSRGGACVVPTSSCLPTPNVILLNAPTNKDSEWFNCFLEVLNVADNARICSLSAPLLGAGTLSRNAEEVVKMMFQVIRKFVASTKGQKSLRLIRIVIYGQQNFLLACLHINALLTGGASRVSTDGGVFSAVFGRVFKNVTSMFWKSAEENEVGFQVVSVEQPLTLLVYGEAENVRKAQKMLDDFCDEKWPERPLIHEAIHHLSLLDIEKIQSLAERKGIEIVFSPDQNKLKLRGANVLEFHEVVRKMLDQFKQELDNVDNNVCWYKRAQNTFDWVKVQVGVKTLEKAYQERSTQLHVFENDENVHVDFAKMVVVKGANEIFALKRRDVRDDIPVNWDSTGQDSGFKLVVLDPASPEYKKVHNASALTSPGINVLQIERVENPAYFKRYLTVKKHTETLLAGANIVERELFHGTADQNVNGICLNGFNRSLAGINGTAYGIGCYFARDIKYSQGYGKKIFQSFVITGRFCVGNANVKVAPDYSVQGEKYDSVVDNVANPSIFVVFTDNHAYPAYVITTA